MLKTLRELPDWELEPGSPNVLGWTVYDSSEHPVGPVVDLLIDTRNQEVRYLGVQLPDGEEVLLPIGVLDLNEEDGALRAINHDREAIEVLPRFVPPALSPEIEARYFVLFRREEPIGAWEPSPLDYQLPPFKARGSRMNRLAQGVRTRGRSVEEAGGAGPFASTMPWAIDRDNPMHPGPQANPEVMWQAEQPGMGAALGTTPGIEGEQPKP